MNLKMKKYLLMLVAVIGMSSLQSCVALRNYNNSNIVNECAEILRSYGYKDYDLKKEYRRTNEWGYDEYTNFWYFSNGNNKLYIAYYSGDVDSPKPSVWSNNKLEGNLENALKSKSIFVVTLDEIGREIK
jgi:hypothetical protein